MIEQGEINIQSRTSLFSTKVYLQDKSATDWICEMSGGVEETGWRPSYTQPETWTMSPHEIDEIVASKHLRPFLAAKVACINCTKSLRLAQHL